MIAGGSYFSTRPSTEDDQKERKEASTDPKKKMDCRSKGCQKGQRSEFHEVLLWKSRKMSSSLENRRSRRKKKKGK